MLSANIISYGVMLAAGTCAIANEYIKPYKSNMLTNPRPTTNNFRSTPAADREDPTSSKARVP